MKYFLNSFLQARKEKENIKSQTQQERAIPEGLREDKTGPSPLIQQISVVAASDDGEEKVVPRFILRGRRSKRILMQAMFCKTTLYNPFEKH